MSSDPCGPAKVGHDTHYNTCVDILLICLEIDLLPGFVCFFVGLLYELEYGIFTGVGTHLLIVLYNSARPRVRVEIKQVIMLSSVRRLWIIIQSSSNSISNRDNGCIENDCAILGINSFVILTHSTLLEIPVSRI